MICSSSRDVALRFRGLKVRMQRKREVEQSGLGVEPVIGLIIN